MKLASGAYAESASSYQLWSALVALKVQAPQVAVFDRGARGLFLRDQEGAEEAGVGWFFLYAKRNTGAVACGYSARCHFSSINFQVCLNGSNLQAGRVRRWTIFISQG